MYLYEEPPIECLKCFEKENVLDDVAYWLRAVLDQLYGLEEFKAESLEHYLGELAACAKIQLPSQDLAVVRKARSSDPSPILEGWKEFNTQYFKSLAKAGV